MRIAVVYSYRREIGGIETYLDTVITALVNSGHSLAYWFELRDDSDLKQISLPKGVPARVRRVESFDHGDGIQSPVEEAKLSSEIRRNHYSFGAYADRVHPKRLKP